MRAKTILLLGLVALGGALVAGCIIPTRTVVHVGPPVEYGYQPMLYNGYVVYYTAAGVPFYWSRGVRVYVPVAYRAVYVDHWHTHRSAYVRWHRHRGHHYRSRHYRGRSHHHGYSKPSRSRHKPVLRPKSRSDKPHLRPKSRSHGSKPTLTPKRKGDKSKPSLKPKKKKKKKKKR